MPELDLRDSLCGDLLRLALSRGDGKLEHHGMLAICVRAALLLDLAMIGAIEQPVHGEHVALDATEPGELQVDLRPTGCRSADELLSRATERPHRSIEFVLRRGRPHLATVTSEFVAVGAWTRRWPRIVPLRHRYVEVDRGDDTNAQDRRTTLTALASPLGLSRAYDIEERITFVDPTPAWWISAEIVEFVRTMRHRREMAAEPWHAAD